MPVLRKLLEPNAQQYAASKGIKLSRFLGDGNDGAVWESSRDTAVKALERSASYEREREAYLRLANQGITDIAGFAVPLLIDTDDTLKIVEMAIVFPPCVLDFAKSYVDHPPEFSPEVIAEWEERTAELFGDDWPVVETILAWLRTYGIHYFDARPGNIRFRNNE
ncbi:MAG: hypothetical protein WD049_09610 [Candidatus Paceibacterota bacterium]